MFGGELPITDEFTLNFMTNPLAYDIHANSSDCREVIHDSKMRVWLATLRDSYVVGVLNANHSYSLNTSVEMSTLRLPPWKSTSVVDVWARSAPTIAAKSLEINIPRAGGQLLLVKDAQDDVHSI